MTKVYQLITIFSLKTHRDLFFDVVIICSASQIEMGDTARKRLSLFATQFENQLNQTRQNFQKNRPGGGVHDAAAGMGGGAGMSAAERRGLLDDGDEEDMIEFEVRKNQ